MKAVCVVMGHLDRESWGFQEPVEGMDWRHHQTTWQRDLWAWMRPPRERPSDISI